LCAVYQSNALPTPKKINVYEQKNNRFQGDIANIPKHPKKTRNGIKFDSRQKWTGAVIPYQISSQIAKQSLVTDAMKAIEANTCVRFVQRQSNHPNYLNIIKTTDGCYSNVGMTRGSQDVSLQDDSTGTCMTPDIIIHELIHAVGLYHEQSRFDRDQYITVNYANIATGLADQFEIVTLDQSDVYNTKYDYYSVMHYDQYSFSKKNGLVTITTKDSAFQNIIGNVKTASEVDFKKIRSIYGCDTAQTKAPPPLVKTNPPPPLVKTNPPPPPPVVTAKPIGRVCLDSAPLVLCLSFRNYCYDSFMIANCRSTCNACP
jgi:astacin